MKSNRYSIIFMILLMVLFVAGKSPAQELKSVIELLEIIETNIQELDTKQKRNTLDLNARLEKIRNDYDPDSINKSLEDIQANISHLESEIALVKDNEVNPVESSGENDNTYTELAEDFRRVAEKLKILAYNTPKAKIQTVANTPVKNPGPPGKSVKFGYFLKSAASYSPAEIGDKSEIRITHSRPFIRGDLNEKTNIFVMLDTEKPGILMFAYMEHKLTSFISVRIGQFKSPFSTDDLVPHPKIAFVNRTYAKSDTSPALFDKGVQATYSYNKKINVIAALMNGSGMNKSDTNNNKSAAFRIEAKVLPTLQLASAFYTGRNNPNDTIRDEHVNLSAAGTSGKWEYSGEVAQKKHDALKGISFYAYAAYDYTTSFGRIPILTPAFRIDFSDPDTNFDNDARTRYTFGLTAHLGKKYTDRVMFNYEFRDAETGDPDDLWIVEYQILR